MKDFAALLARLQTGGCARRIVGVVGPPGSGKSTLAAQIVAATPGAALLPMDGFHLDNRILSNRGLLSRKGAPETFDSHGFRHLLKRIRTEDEVFYPIFDRVRDLAIAGAGCVNPDDTLIVVEGNYLLLDSLPWDAAREAFDFIIWIDEPLSVIETRLTARWRALGCDEAGIAAHLENDLANARLTRERSVMADLSVRPSSWAETP